MMAFCPVIAQDTVHIRDLRQVDKYYVPVWPSEFLETNVFGKNFLIGWMEQWGEGFPDSKEMAFKQYTDDTLQVYGIAAGLSTDWRLNPESYAYDIRHGRLDTSCEFLYNNLRLYEADPDSLRPIGEELLVNLRYTPVSYYIDLDLYRYATGPELPLVPMYERYFSSPVTVTDSFYVGRRYRTDHLDDRHVLLLTLSDTVIYGYQYYAVYYDFIREYSTGTFELHQWVYDWINYQMHPFLFPIIAPPDTTVNPGDTIVTPIDTVINSGDTLVVLPGDTLVIGGDTIVNTGDTIVIIPGEPFIIGGDTIVVNPGDSVIVIPGGTPGVGLRPNDLIYRYTSVAPNPAKNSVRVTSSFGLSRLEAYDAHGRLIKECNIQHSALSIDLDVSSWPSGTYLLRITTPAGLTTKKLLIQ